MKTERQIRIESELANFKATSLEKPMFDLSESCIEELVSESGYSSAKSYLNDRNSWSDTLRSTVEGLVNALYTSEGERYETKAEVEEAIVCARA